LETELRNVYVTIPLLQKIKDVPIYEKTIMELCIKNTRRKIKDPSTIQVIGQLDTLMSGKTLMEKYIDPRNLVFIVPSKQFP